MPIGLAYALFYDGTKTDSSLHTEQEFGAVLEKSFFNGLSNTKSTGTIDIGLTKADLNGVFKKARSGLDPAVRDRIDGFYVDINGANYTFTIEANVPLFNTRAFIETTLKEEDNATDPLQGRFIFTINNVKFGRIGGIENFALAVAKGPIQDAMKSLETSLAQNGIHVSIDLDNKSIIYTKQNLQNDITNMLGNQNKLLTSAFSQFMGDGFVHLNDSIAETFAFTADLKKLHDNPTYVDANNDLGINLDGYARNLETALAANNALAGRETEFFTYLIRGYQGVEASTQSLVEGLDLSSISIADPTAYEGENLEAGADLSQTVQSQINATTILTEHKIADLKEEDINAFLASSSAIGQGNVLVNAEKKAAYVTIDNFNCNVLDGVMYLVVGLSINGYETRIILDTAYRSFSNYKLILDVNNVYIGEVGLSAALKQEIDAYLSDALGNSSMVTYDGANKLVSIDFASAVANSGCTAIIEATGTPKLSLKGTSVTDPNAMISMYVE